MKTLITNLEERCLFDVSIKTQAEGLISLHEKGHKETGLDKFFKGGNVKIETGDPVKASNKIANIIKGAKKHGKVFVAFDGNGVGPLLAFVASKEGADAIFTCYNGQVIRLPPLKLDLSAKKSKILEVLSQEDLSAVEIGKKVGISRSTVYKHLNKLIELGLVKQPQTFEKYKITQTGMLAIV